MAKALLFLTPLFTGLSEGIPMGEAAV